MSELNKQLEELLDFFHDENYRFQADFDGPKGERVVVMSKYDIRVTLVREEKVISYDVYADLRGIYEIGELHVLLTGMLRAKDRCRQFGLRERNTTERLYPPDRTGENTQTSGL